MLRKDKAVEYPSNHQLSLNSPLWKNCLSVCSRQFPVRSGS